MRTFLRFPDFAGLAQLAMMVKDEFFFPQNSMGNSESFELEERAFGNDTGVGACKRGVPKSHEVEEDGEDKSIDGEQGNERGDLVVEIEGRKYQVDTK